MTDGIVLAAALVGTVEAPCVVGAGCLAARPSVTRGAAALPRPATHAPVLTLTCLIALCLLGVGKAGMETGGSEVTWGTLALSRDRVAGASIVTLAFLFAADTVAFFRATQATVPSSQARWAVAVTGNRVAEGLLRALALLLTPLAPPAHLTVQLTLVTTTTGGTCASARRVVTRLVRPARAPLVTLLTVEPGRTHCLAPVAGVAGRAVAPAGRWVTGGALLTVTHTATVSAPRPLVAGFLAVFAPPARGTRAVTADRVTVAAMMTPALMLTPGTIPPALAS